MVHADLEAMDRRIRALDDEELRKELSFAEAAGLEAHDNAGHWLLLTMERDRRQREQQ